MTVEQMHLWDLPLTAESLLEAQVRELSQQQNNLRRGLFKRFDELQKEMNRLREELEVMKGEKKEKEGSLFVWG